MRVLGRLLRRSLDMADGGSGTGESSRRFRGSFYDDYEFTHGIRNVYLIDE
jgi:hypothetical protein